ncbi:MAG: hypothetical protein ABIY55_01505 [Kofleriaceae bacterium]
MNTNPLACVLLKVLLPLLVVALGWLALKVAQLAMVRTKSEQQRGARLRLDDAVAVAVREVDQMMVDRTKSTNPDGRLMADERSRAKQAAVDSAMWQLGADGVAQIATAFGLPSDAVNRLIGARVEAAVHDLHARRARWSGDGGTAGDIVPFSA